MGSFQVVVGPVRGGGEGDVDSRVGEGLEEGRHTGKDVTGGEVLPLQRGLLHKKFFPGKGELGPAGEDLTGLVRGKELAYRAADRRVVSTEFGSRGGPHMLRYY